MRGLMWFREDLRTHDNRALFEAAEACVDGVVALYIIDKSMWHRHHTAPCRVEFILRGLHVLKETLSRLAIPMLVREVEDTKDIPQVILMALDAVKADALFYNHQYQQNEKLRDKAVETLLTSVKKKCLGFHDETILPLIKDHKKSFEFFKPIWQKLFIQQSGLKQTWPIYEQRELGIPSDSLPESFPEFKSDIDPTLWPAGEDEAKRRLKQFAAEKLETYHLVRSDASLEWTSLLSPYLATGMISPRLCFQIALDANESCLGIKPTGPAFWMNELIWRDYYRHLIDTVPRLSMGHAYHEKMDKVKWDFDQKLFDAWRDGKTGFPILDAAMRQLKQTGWMPGKLRMLAATFLAKNLFFDWRLGEQHFMTHLIDGDFCSNNGNWQMCAATGPDTPAYYRYFDLMRHSEKCDPEAKYIKKYCPELESFTSFGAHAPFKRSPAQALKVNLKDKYPEAILSLKASRADIIEKYHRDVYSKMEL